MGLVWEDEVHRSVVPHRLPDPSPQGWECSGAYALVAQMEERPASNWMAAGSNPAWGATERADIGCRS